jgi:uncharacterized membrane protein YedE/YeeE
MTFLKLTLIGFLFGVGFGYFVQRVGLCFANGLGEIFIGRGKRIARLFIIIFVITSVGFLLSGYISPVLGLKPIGEIRGYGFYNLLAGILFGAGIFLNGGCILGTLRQIGEGNMTFLVILISFIPGMALIVYGIDPFLQSNYTIQKAILPDVLGIPAPWIIGLLIIGNIAWFQNLRYKK